MLFRSITGFGRLGTAFAADYYGVVPDMINFAKAATNGVIPLGGVICRGSIYDALMSGPEHLAEFFHGYTYSGHPVACAAALATLDLFAAEGLFARAAALGRYLGDAMHGALRGLPNVVGLRTLGCAGAVELAPIAGSPGKRGYEVFLDCFRQGALVRVAGENLVLAPPFVTSHAEVDALVDALATAIKRAA